VELTLDDLDVAGSHALLLASSFVLFAAAEATFASLASLAAFSATLDGLVVGDVVAIHLHDHCTEFIGYDKADQRHGADRCEQKLLHGGCSCWTRTHTKTRRRDPVPRTESCRLVVRDPIRLVPQLARVQTMKTSLNRLAKTVGERRGVSPTCCATHQ